MERQIAYDKRAREIAESKIARGLTAFLDDHDVVPISSATEARRLAGFTAEEIERLIRTT